MEKEPQASIDIANDGRIRGKGRAARRRAEQGARGYPDGPRAAACVLG